MICNVNGSEIYYEIVGEGKPLVMIHGYQIDHRSMKFAMEPGFKERQGFMRLYFDLPGMGKSRGAGHITHSDHMLDTVTAFIDTVLPDQAFTVAGLSYGGYMARGLINRWPDRVDGALLICPCIYFDREKRTLPPFKLFDIDEAFISGLSTEEKAYLENFVVRQTEYVWNRYKKDIIPSLGLADMRLLDRVRDTEFSFKVDTLDRSFQKPALIMVGRYDVATGYKDAWDIYDNFPNGTFVVINHAGHCLPMEQPELFNAHVNAWLSQVLDNGGET